MKKDTISITYPTQLIPLHEFLVESWIDKDEMYEGIKSFVLSWSEKDIDNNPFLVMKDMVIMCNNAVLGIICPDEDSINITMNASYFDARSEFSKDLFSGWEFETLEELGERGFHLIRFNK